MKRWQRFFAGVAVATGMVGSATAQQFPGIPSPTPVPAAPVPAAAPQQTLWSWLGVSKPQKEQCRQWLCQTQLGLLLSNGMAPASMFSGGIIPPLCPGLPTAAELNSENPAVAAAANIKKDEAEAKARRAAVRYLSTVSCHYWPEAEDALIAALMFDRNECVRWEAAIALGTGCCCTKNTIEALAITASGSKKKRNFTEKSERVRAAAEAALYHCLDCYHEIVPAPTGPEKPPEEPAKSPEEPITAKPRPSNIQLAAFYAGTENKSMADVLDNARKVLHDTAARTPSPTGNFTTGNRNVYQIFTNSMQLQSRKMKVFGIERNTQPPAAAEPQPETPSNLIQLLRNRRDKRDAEDTEDVDMGIRKTQPSKPMEVIPAHSTAPVAVPPAAPPAVHKKSEPAPNAPPVTAAEPPLAGLDRAKSAAPSVATSGTSANTDTDSQGWSAKKATSRLLDRFTKSKAPPKPEPVEAQQAAQTPTPPIKKAPPTVEPVQVQHAPVPPTPPIKTVAHVLSQPSAPVAKMSPVSNSRTSTPMPSTAFASSPSIATKPLMDPAARTLPAIAPPASTGNNAMASAKPMVQPSPQVRPTAIVAHASDSSATNARDRGMPSVPGLLIIFQDSPESPQRQWAVQVLSRHDWNRHPEVVPALLAGAQKDTDRAVRIQCIRCLTTRQINSPAVLAAFRDLQKDTDPRVQQEASEGLARLSGGATGTSAGEVGFANPR